jgi:hypothetical protein
MEIMAHAVLRQVIEQIKSRTHYAIIVDETTDISTQEQASICFRTVDNSFDVHEDFVGLYNTSATDSATLTALIKDVLLRSNMQIEKCRGQCYDGAANMSGGISGVATRILTEEPRATNIKCFTHCLNLAVQSCTTQNPLIEDTMNITQEVCKLLGASAKRAGHFQLNNKNMHLTLQLSDRCVLPLDSALTFSKVYGCKFQAHYYYSG